jgi:predicted NUDIX family NTP pyrophosphohydrolase
MKRSKTSAGLLMFRRTEKGAEVLLVHPGGPFFRKKVIEGEELLARARLEFREELGIEPAATGFIELGSVEQKGGKTVHAWAFEGDLPENFVVVSNTFELEWPPRSGRRQQFPEIDQAAFFPIGEAEAKINPAQVPLLERLSDIIAEE